MSAPKENVKRTEETQALVHAATRFYLETGNDPTVADLAARLGWTESKIRRLLTAAHGCPMGLTYRTEERPSYEKNYGMQRGVHKVSTYGPSRDRLRALILNHEKAQREERGEPEPWLKSEGGPR